MTCVHFSPDFKGTLVLKDTGRYLQVFSRLAVCPSPIIFNETYVPSYFKDA